MLLLYFVNVIFTSYVVLYPVDGSGTCVLISFGDSGSSKSTVVVVVVYLKNRRTLKYGSFQIISVNKETHQQKTQFNMTKKRNGLKIVFYL